MRKPYNKYSDAMRVYLKTQIHQLRSKEDFTFKQISRKLGIPTTTVFQLYSEYLTELSARKSVVVRYAIKAKDFVMNLIDKVKHYEKV